MKLNGKRILVTGGTGSFGKAFVKKVLQEYPKFEKMVIFSRDEYKQYQMKNLPQFQDRRLRFFIGNVRDLSRLNRAFQDIDIVVHAAALKQIPVCEYNPLEAVKTNVNGAQNVIDAALDSGVEKVVALSTDKACSPINLYGATKLCSDKLFIAANAYAANSGTRFAVVRYGNVAGSRGSVVPYFRTLLGNGSYELPITDPRMTRFWLKMEQAIDLVLTALNHMNGGEMYVKKIPSVRIGDLVKAIDSKATTKVVGIRPGEKLHEMMISSDDARSTYEYKEFYMIEPVFDWFDGKRRKRGKKVKEDFEYHSGNNPDFLSVSKIKKLISELPDETDDRLR